MSVNIESLVEQGVNVKIEVSAADLKMFGEGTPECVRRHAQPVGKAWLSRARQGREQEYVCYE